MAFLSASWANMAENVVEKDRLYETLGNNQQIVIQQHCQMQMDFNYKYQRVRRKHK